MSRNLYTPDNNIVKVAQPTLDIEFRRRPEFAIPRRQAKSTRQAFIALAKAPVGYWDDFGRSYIGIALWEKPWSRLVGVCADSAQLKGYAQKYNLLESVCNGNGRCDVCPATIDCMNISRLEDEIPLRLVGKLRLVAHIANTINNMSLGVYLSTDVSEIEDTCRDILAAWELVFEQPTVIENTPPRKRSRDWEEESVLELLDSSEEESCDDTKPCDLEPELQSDSAFFAACGEICRIGLDAFVREGQWYNAVVSQIRDHLVQCGYQSVGLEFGMQTYNKALKRDLNIFGCARVHTKCGLCQLTKPCTFELDGVKIGSKCVKTVEAVIEHAKLLRATAAHYATEEIDREAVALEEQEILGRLAQANENKRHKAQTRAVPSMLELAHEAIKVPQINRPNFDVLVQKFVVKALVNGRSSLTIRMGLSSDITFNGVEATLPSWSKRLGRQNEYFKRKCREDLVLFWEKIAKDDFYRDFKISHPQSDAWMLTW